MGINTITDFLQKKGVKSDGSPNALVDAETYALLEKEFGAGRAVNSERVNIRERIAQKQATVTLDDDAKGKGGKNDEELLVKSNVISVKDEVASMGPKILGKIDLSGKGPKAAPAATPAPAPRPAGCHERGWRFGQRLKRTPRKLSQIGGISGWRQPYEKHAPAGRSTPIMGRNPVASRRREESVHNRLKQV